MKAIVQELLGERPVRVCVVEMGGGVPPDVGLGSTIIRLGVLQVRGMIPAAAQVAYLLEEAVGAARGVETMEELGGGMFMAASPTA